MNFGHPTTWLGPLVASFLMAVTPGQAAGQAPAVPLAPPASPFGITDNSFLVEEAFNQEAGIFQNIFVFSRTRQRTVCACTTFTPQVHHAWDMSFTQEWPMGGVRHQLSYTLPLSGEAGERQLGALLNYRFQLMSERAGRPAISPRLSLIMPTTGDAGDNEWGLQANLPVSKRTGAVYFHGNAGATWRRIDQFVGRSQRGFIWRVAPVLAGSAVWAVRPMFQLMIESVVDVEPTDTPGRATTVTVAPGLRGGWNFGDKQFVLGLAFPLTRGTDAGSRDQIRERALLLYASYELPWGRRSPRPPTP